MCSVLCFRNVFDKIWLWMEIVHAITSNGATSIAQYKRTPSIKLITNFVLLQHPLSTHTPNRKQICYIGRLDIYQKGIGSHVESFSTFVQRHSDVTFVLVGLYQPAEITAFTKLFNKHVSPS